MGLTDSKEECNLANLPKIDQQKIRLALTGWAICQNDAECNKNRCTLRGETCRLGRADENCVTKCFIRRMKQKNIELDDWINFMKTLEAALEIPAPESQIGAREESAFRAALAEVEAEDQKNSNSPTTNPPTTNAPNANGNVLVEVEGFSNKPQSTNNLLLVALVLGVILIGLNKKRN